MKSAAPTTPKTPAPGPRSEPRSTDPNDYQAVPRPLAAMPKTFRDGHRVAPHRHRRAQLIYAVSGTMTIDTDGGTWLVPPDLALWMPPGEMHAITMAGEVDMRTLYIDGRAGVRQQQRCEVLTVTPLLRELIVRATELPVLYDEIGPSAAVMTLILDEIRTAPTLPLHLPMPTDRRLIRLCRLVQADLEAEHSRDQLAAEVGLSPRSLTRLFRAQTGLGFSEWRQRARLLAALGRISAGERITTVALSLGYASPGAFAVMFRRVLGVAPSAYRVSSP
jgi:AraC-like DNA-binding protein/mannose-6-phosphate isomerase-like protein (cupin superfamily)